MESLTRMSLLTKLNSKRAACLILLFTMRLLAILLPFPWNTILVINDLFIIQFFRPYIGNKYFSLLLMGYVGLSTWRQFYLALSLVGNPYAWFMEFYHRAYGFIPDYLISGYEARARNLTLLYYPLMVIQYTSPYFLISFWTEWRIRARKLRERVGY